MASSKETSFVNSARVEETLFGRLARIEAKEETPFEINKVEEETHVRVPWIVALASYKDNMISQAVREGQRKSWKISNVFEGPDTDELEKKYRHDNIHFNEMGTRTAADLWTEKIYNAFFKSPELLKDSILAKAH